MMEFALSAAAMLLLVALGALVGVQSAFFGIGGGWVVTPLLHLIGLPAPAAVGTGMAYLAGTATLSAAKHAQNENVDFKLGFAYGLFMMTGVEGARRLLLWMEHSGLADRVFQALYILLLLWVGSHMLRQALRERTAGSDPEAPPPFTTSPAHAGHAARILFPVSGARIHVARIAAEGLAIGVLAGTMGVGGGFALVPLLCQIHGVPMIRAVATSLVAVALTGLAGTIGFAQAHDVQWHALPLFVGSVLGVPWGVRAARLVSAHELRALYGILLCLGAVAVATGAAGFRRTAIVLAVSAATMLTAIVLALARRKSVPGKRP